jgi:hypothetical protein
MHYKDELENRDSILKMISKGVIVEALEERGIQCIGLSNHLSSTRTLYHVLASIQIETRI